MGMDPEFVADWDKTKARFDAWWHNDMADRPPTLVTCKREKARWGPRPMPEDVDPVRTHLDIQYRIDEIENTLAWTDYLGDAVPTFRRGINTGYLGLFAGAVPKFAEGTVWIEPCVDDWSAATKPAFDTSLPMFQQIVEVSEALLANARGRYMLAFPDHLDAVTTMSQMRGVEDLCVDLLEDRDPACAFRDALTEVWKQSFDFWVEHDGRLGGDGVINWARAYSTTRGGVLQCDFSAMISPTMFEWFVRPELAAQAAHLDGAMYHLDGPGELPHVDILCDIPGLTAIQWVVGAGNPRPVEWPDLLKKLQDRGKAVQVYAKTEDLDRLFEILQPKGVMFVLRDELAPDAAREALRKIDAWAARG